MVSNKYTADELLKLYEEYLPLMVDNIYNRLIEHDRIKRMFELFKTTGQLPICMEYVDYKQPKDFNEYLEKRELWRRLAKMCQIKTRGSKDK